MTGRATTWPSDHPRAVEDPSHREDRRLPGAEDRRAAVDAEDADVRQRDGAPGEVRRRGPPGAGRLDQRLHRAGELEQPQLRRTLDRRDEQPAGRVGRDAEVHLAVHHDVRAVGRVDPRGVDHRVAHGRPDEAGCHQDHRRDAQARPRPAGRAAAPRTAIALLMSTSTHSVTCGAVNADCTIASAIARCTPRTGTRSPGTIAGAGSASRASPVSRARAPLRALRRARAHDVRPRHLALRARRRHGGQVDSEVAGELAHRRLRPHRAVRRIARPAGRVGSPGAAGDDAARPRPRARRSPRARPDAPRRRGIRRLDRDDRRAHRHDRALGDEQLGHRAREGARQLDGRLRGLDLDDQLVDLDDVAGPHVPAQDLGLGQALARRPGRAKARTSLIASITSVRHRLGRRRRAPGRGPAGSAPRAGWPGRARRSR